MNFGSISVTWAAPSPRCAACGSSRTAQGFDWFSVSDHFQESPPRGATSTATRRSPRSPPRPWTRGGSASAAASTGVAYPEPRAAPKSLTTIDHLSNGRVDCGSARAGTTSSQGLWVPVPLDRAARGQCSRNTRKICGSSSTPSSVASPSRARTSAWWTLPITRKPVQPASHLDRRGAARSAPCGGPPRSTGGRVERRYIGPEDWTDKSRVLDSDGARPRDVIRRRIMPKRERSAFLPRGRRARGPAAADELFRPALGGSPIASTRHRYLRGTVKDAREMVEAVRALGCTRLCIALREGPRLEALEGLRGRDRRAPLTAVRARKALPVRHPGGGTSSAGCESKKPAGLKHEADRGPPASTRASPRDGAMWWAPKVYQSTTSVFLERRVVRGNVGADRPPPGWLFGYSPAA